MQLSIDRGWLLEILEQRLGDHPDISDWGATAAAVARHSDTIMDQVVYPEPHHRAASLLHSLLRVPALAHSNEIFALSVAYGFLNMCGLTVSAKADEVGDLVEATLAGTLDVRQIAARFKNWTT
ncbi:fic family toxin-antitoxin system, toxin component [Streptomyces sp. NBC_01433]|uniref:fic family toxin-antitoxin system, toxin component n=1 Tax=Streptomyces sp. NBC_01433 TaxID=2903864 RepID=UPI0022594280|nr:fic family toxin-antitoxin system, toxin component [Streptomyces sp. NBC_01433]MCX4682235.1 fic family toxin-antitoxin system, toxin component [Streptomyces sp. NBC_01433]